MPSQTRVFYQVSMPHRTAHYYHVKAQFHGPFPNDEFTVSLPTWTPGSYLIREYARHVVQIRASDNGGQPLPITSINKAEWRIQLRETTSTVTIDYDVYAYELTVRTSYLDNHYGIIAGASLFLYNDAFKSFPLEVHLQVPSGWDIATTMTPIELAEHRYHAQNYDGLVDSPIQLGHLTRIPFTVDDIPHELVIGGFGDALHPPESLVNDVTRIIHSARDFFGSLPYSHYLFFVTIADRAGGGLEHRNGATIMVSPDLFCNPKRYPQLLSLFAHEYFHLWNVKRLRPLQFEPFDYQHEVYTSILWALEGLTDYFAQWLLAKSGVLPVRKVLDQWAKNLHALWQLPGREWTSLSDASEDAWIRQYRPDSNSANITISYYLKGALLGIFLDLNLRQHSADGSGLDSIWRSLWDIYGDQGFPEHAIEDLIIEVGGEPLATALQRYVHGTDWFDETLLSSVGLRLEKTFQHPDEPQPVWTGTEVVERQGKLYAATVYRDSPSERGGLCPDDEILALDHQRIASRDEWRKVLQVHPASVPFTLHVAHRGTLDTLTITPEEPHPDQWQLVSLAHPSAAQEKAFLEWLGQPFPFSNDA